VAHPQPPPPEQVEADVARALAEDLGSGDLTAGLLADEPQQGYVLAKEAAVVAGRPWFDACLRALDPEVRLHWQVADGDAIAPHTVVCRFEGRVRALLGAERCALNFLQTLSATATRTAEFVAAVAGTRARILDTRKTLPGLRLAQKYAVRCGGGDNHRMGLYDAIMLKENHILAAGSIATAAQVARSRYPQVPLIIEVESLDELRQALAAGCTRILLDDFAMEDMREAVRIADGRIPLEVSGSVSLERVRAIADTGVDCISIGALTKHVRAIDYSMKLGRGPA
jgi:nicotinate-nucleotide pyrophosphorylase (carboxylating)